MPIIHAPEQFNVEDLFFDLRGPLGLPVHLKCEGFNFAGSIKLKAAVSMVEAAERQGLLDRDSVLIESSSGNLGVALSMIAASRGYAFECVTDARCNLATRLLMEAMGSRVKVITEAHPERGLLGARLDYVRERCAGDPRYVWLNQHANPDNWRAHYRSTAPAIARNFPELDVLFVGAGTTGTLMGCARYFARVSPRTTIVAIDSVGSVTFGVPAGPRMIPGLGAGVRPALLDESFVDHVVHVPEAETVRVCHQLARHGFLFGGSTGTVIAGARRWLAEHQPPDPLTAVAIAPDLGERYLDTVYQSNWVDEFYGSEVLEHLDAAAGPATAGSALTANGDNR